MQFLAQAIELGVVRFDGMALIHTGNDDVWTTLRAVVEIIGEHREVQALAMERARQGK